MNGIQDNISKMDENHCILKSISQLQPGKPGPEVEKNGPDFDKDFSKEKDDGAFENMAFQDHATYSNGEASVTEVVTQENEFNFRGLSKNEVVKRSKHPMWCRMRQTLYMMIFILWTGLIIALIVIGLVHPKCRSQPATSWWQGAVYYRVYVPMFKDSNGDCKGDFQGIVSKLDYLKDIGVDAVSLSPVYPEDNNDVEFSITNHTDVDSQYGSVQDLIELINAVHKKGMYLVLDFIPAMTGKQHKWFQESQISGGKNRNNFYVWVNGNSIPNNWNSQMNGSAWTFSSTRNASFLHQIDPSLPDLNLRSAIVVDELNEVLRYWMSLGVDGFNLRHLGLLLEDYDLRDEPEAQPSVTNDTNAYEYLDHKYTLNLAENFNLLRMWRNVVNTFDNKTRIVMAGMDSNNRKGVTSYEAVYGRAGLSLPPYALFWDPPAECGGICMKNYINGKLDGISNKNSVIWMIGNDMTPRLKVRMNNDVKRQEVLTMVTFLLPGSVLIYNGDEINMDDDYSPNHWNLTSKVKPWRNPMLWDDSLRSGFSNSSCLNLPPEQNDTITVKNQLSSASSMLNFIRNLTKLRKDQGIHLGDFHYSLIDEDVFSFVRGFDGTNCFLVAVNLNNKTITRNFASGPGAVNSDANVKILTPSSLNKPISIEEEIDTSSISLDGYQGIVVSWSCGLRQ